VWENANMSATLDTQPGADATRVPATGAVVTDVGEPPSRQFGPPSRQFGPSTRQAS
jgi:hypothetical protein